jgi:hypothetical protein
VLTTVRMGMSVAEGAELADELLTLPADAAQRVHDQLWLRTVLVEQRRRTRIAERAGFDARADRVLAAAGGHTKIGTEVA